MTNYFGEPSCAHRFYCAAKAVSRSKWGEYKRPRFALCPSCPFIPVIQKREALDTAALTRNIDVILTQPSDSKLDS
jgi:hypothetical protein